MSAKLSQLLTYMYASIGPNYIGLFIIDLYQQMHIYIYGY